MSFILYWLANRVWHVEGKDFRHIAEFEILSIRRPWSGPPSLSTLPKLGK